MTFSPAPDDPVLVGVDGSDESLAAVRWAADEAARLAVPLRIVHAWMWPLYHVHLGAPPGAPTGAGLRAQAERVLERAADRARAVASSTPVETSLVTGAAAAELLRSAEGARLLVVGHRGLGGFAGLLLGSVGVTVSAHAPCPVVVVRGAATVGPVVVGVDGSAGSAAAISTAFAEASRRDADLVAVHAWALPMRDTSPASDGYEALVAQGEREGTELVERALVPARAMFPGVPVTVRLGDGSPAGELVEASDEAQLVVVGSRGLGNLRGLVLGSTAHALIHHARCPVLIDRG
jgi:nucleotide-binding universal stress UspA family protein